MNPGHRRLDVRTNPGPGLVPAQGAHSPRRTGGRPCPTSDAIAVGRPAVSDRATPVGCLIRQAEPDRIVSLGGRPAGGRRVTQVPCKHTIGHGLEAGRGLPDTRTIDRYRGEPFLVGFGLADDLMALDLAGSWPTRAGASQAIASGRRDVARAWSRVIYASYDQVHGLLYPSSMAGHSTNLAIDEPGRHLVARRPPVHLPLTHTGLRLPVQRVAQPSWDMPSDSVALSDVSAASRSRRPARSC